MIIYKLLILANRLFCAATQKSLYSRNPDITIKWHDAAERMGY